MTRTNYAFAALHGALDKVFTQVPAQPFPPYAPDVFHNGVSRLDTTHFFASPAFPDIILLENWRHLSAPENELVRDDSGRRLLIPAKPTYTHPRFFLSLDRRHYALFDERHVKPASLSVGTGRINDIPGALMPHDADLEQGEHRNIEGLFDMVGVSFGTYCLTPWETDDSKKLFLSFDKDGTVATLQLGNDPDYSIQLYAGMTLPRRFAVAETSGDASEDGPSAKAKKVAQTEIKPGDFMLPATFDSFFAGASLYVAGQDADATSEFGTASARSLDDIMAELNRLVGLKPVKEQIHDFADMQKFIAIRKVLGFKEENQLKLHASFIGNPGTGKTTVAQLLGGMYRELGLLSKGHVHKVTRDDLIGKYIGQTAPKVLSAIEKARGGVLFIDEAYGLARSVDDRQDFGREAIEMLLQEMSDGPGDIAIVFAGYPKEMHTFVASNPGLESRMSFYNFGDYSADELMQIAEVITTERELKLDVGARAVLEKAIRQELAKKAPNFANARFIERIIDRAKTKLARRALASAFAIEVPSREALETLTAEDITAALADMPNLKLPGEERSAIGFGRGRTG